MKEKIYLTMARKRKGTTRKPVLFIACEGTRTEYDYFTSWAQRDDVLAFFENVEVYPDTEEEENPQTNPYKLVEMAGERLRNGSCNYAWVVSDRDGHSKMPEMFQDAKDKGVRIAFSARSFEEWVLMHFEKNDFAFTVTECKTGKKPLNCGTASVPDCKSEPCLCGHIRRSDYIPDYHKSCDVYGKTVPFLEIAKINSAWLRWRVKASFNKIQPPIHSLNPYTDVDQLILFLQQKKEIIEWGAAGNYVSISNWQLHVFRTDTEIRLELSHHYPERKLVNEVFSNTNFYGVDDSLQTVTLQCIKRQVIINNNGSTENLLEPEDILELTFSYNAMPYFLFCYPDENLRLFIEL